MTTAAILLIGVAGLWGLGLAGVLLLIRLTGSRNSWARAEIFGASLLAGVGLTGWLMFLWSLTGASLNPSVSWTLALAGLGAGLVSAWRMGLLQTAFGRCHDDCIPRTPLGSLFRVLTVALWTITTIEALLTPQRLWDERAIFGIKSAMIFTDQSIDNDRRRDPDVVQYHPRYPLLLPLPESHFYFLTGELEDRWGKLVPPLLWLGLLLYFAGVLSRTFGVTRGWLGAFLLASVPAMFAWDYGVLTAQGDLPVGCLHGMSVLSLWDYLRHRGSAGNGWRLILAGIAAGWGMFTKDEGMAFILVDSAVLVVLTIAICWRTQSVLSGLIRLTAFFLPVAVVVGPWLLHRRTLPVTTEMTYFSRLGPEELRAGLSTLGWSVPHLVQRMFREASTWGLHWWGVLLTACLRPGRAITAPQLFLLLDMAGGLAALLVAGMLAPLPVEDHIGGSAHRFLLQITPVAVLFLMGQWGEPIERGSDSTMENAT